MFIKLMILIVILACVAPFFIKGPTGEPLMTLEDWIPDEMPEVRSTPEETVVYKWKDENGVWQFTNEPVEGLDVEQMVLDGQINTMESLQKPDRMKRATSINADAIPSGLLTVAPDKVSEMMDTVNNLQETIDQRKADMDRTTGQSQ